MSAKTRQPISEYPFEETLITLGKGEITLDEVMSEYKERVAAAVAEALALLKGDADERIP